MKEASLIVIAIAAAIGAAIGSMVSGSMNQEQQQEQGQSQGNDVVKDETIFNINISPFTENASVKKK